MEYVYAGIVALLVAFWIVTPLLGGGQSARAATKSTSTGRDSTALKDQRDSLLRALKELEFDRSMGKVEDDEYEAQRADLATQTSTILDRLEGRAAPKATRQMPAEAGPLAALLEIEVLVARYRSKPRGGWKCTCGREMMTSDRFCASCGSPFAGTETAKTVAATAG